VRRLYREKGIVMNRQLHKVFLKGLIVIAPAIVTVYVIYWLASTLESVLGVAVKSALPAGYYVPGMGLVLAIMLITAGGILLDFWIIRQLWCRMEGWFNRLPLFKSIYGAVKDLTDFMEGGASGHGQQVVMVTMPGSSMRLLGFVTRNDFSDLPDAIGTDETVAVYLPMSYQLGGYTVMMPASYIEPVDMEINQAMRFAITGGMTPKHPQPHVPYNNDVTSPER
jgi:uncharacterized membrane protein